MDTDAPVVVGAGVAISVARPVCDSYQENRTAGMPLNPASE